MASTAIAAIADDDINLVVTTDMRVTVVMEGMLEELGSTAGNGPIQARQADAADASRRSLRALMDAGAEPDALLVLTPDTVGQLHRAVTRLWDEGVIVVHTRLELARAWDDADRPVLAGELAAVAREMLARRNRGQRALFAPFAASMQAALDAAMPMQDAVPPSLDAAMPMQDAVPPSLDAAMPMPVQDAVPPSQPGTARERLHMGVAASGRLQPFAAMSGASQDTSPESALRMERYVRALCAEHGHSVGLGMLAESRRLADENSNGRLVPRWRARMVGVAAAACGVAVALVTVMGLGAMRWDAPEEPTPMVSQAGLYSPLELEMLDLRLSGYRPVGFELPEAGALGLALGPSTGMPSTIMIELPRHAEQKPQLGSEAARALPTPKL